MQTKLTLRLDDQLIADAKRWSRDHGISLSALVANYLARLPAESSDLTPWTRSFVGIMREPGQPAIDPRAARAAYREHLAAKHM
jgi:hypothetical protein